MSIHSWHVPSISNRTKFVESANINNVFFPGAPGRNPGAPEPPRKTLAPEAPREKKDAEHYEAMHPGKDLPKAPVKSNVSKTRLVFAKSTKPKKPKKSKKMNAGKILTRPTGVQRLNPVKALNN